MDITPAHRALAEKFVFKKQVPDILVGDSLLQLVAHAYTEEEAEIVTKLGFVPKTAKWVAKQVNRPIEEISPLLASLADRLLIVELTLMGTPHYGFITLLPGVFEFQMVRSRNDKENQAYYKEFARLYEEVYHEYMLHLKPRLEKKKIRFMRIIPIEKALENTTGVLPYPTDLFSEMAARSRIFCIADVCPCRQEHALLGKDCSAPKDVCAAMGWLAELAIEKGIGKRVSREEFLETKHRAAKAGLVNMVDNLTDPLQVCSCCSCCCSGMRILNTYNIPSGIAKSRYEAVVDTNKCSGCGMCKKKCPMFAISIVNKKAVIDYARCIGCGVCVVNCEKENALCLVPRDEHKQPSDTLFLFLLARRAEFMGNENRFFPRLTLGAGSVFGKLVSRVSPYHVSGPGFKTRAGNISYHKSAKTLDIQPNIDDEQIKAAEPDDNEM